MTDFDPLWADLDGKVERYGFTVMGIFDASGQDAPWCYSAGMALHGLADLVIHGWSHDVANGVLQGECHRAIAEGVDLELGLNRTVLANDYPVWCVPVDEPADPLYPLAAARRYADAERPLRAIQIVLPDVNRRFPWHAEYAGLEKPYPIRGTVTQ